MRTTQFRCLRNFWFAGRGDCRVGELLDLTDEQARELVGLGDTVEPVNPKDRASIAVGPPRVGWETPSEGRKRVEQDKRLRMAVADSSWSSLAA